MGFFRGSPMQVRFLFMPRTGLLRCKSSQSISHGAPGPTPRGQLRNVHHPPPSVYFSLHDFLLVCLSVQVYQTILDFKYTSFLKSPYIFIHNPKYTHTYTFFLQCGLQVDCVTHMPETMGLPLETAFFRKIICEQKNLIIGLPVAIGAFFAKMSYYFKRRRHCARFQKNPHYSAQRFSSCPLPVVR